MLKANGIAVDHEAGHDDHNVVVINTCGFIENAKQESIDTILSWARAKDKGQVEKVYVTGCLSQRYQADILDELPEIDGIMADVNAAQRETHRGPAAQQQYQPAPPRDDSAVSKSATYMQAKTADMVYTAKTAQLEYEERIGKLMRADEVKSYQAGKIASLREAFLQIPSRLVPVLAAETDPAKIHVLLEDEIVRAMALVSGEMTNGRA